MIRVLVADDQTLVRTGFRLILDAEPGIRVVGEAADGDSAVRLARRLRPDVTVVEARLPRIDGIRVTELLAGVPDPLRVLVVALHDVDDTFRAASAAGASGFLFKDSRPRLLVEAVRAAARGEAVVSPPIATRLLRHFTRTGRRTPRRDDARLTARESAVVLAVARGRTDVEIAADLSISTSTVKTHLAGARTKLDARNRTEIAIWAWEGGLVPE
ncbi:response regulator transcription factor [Umezawaea tangerina]|uniref:DNA-binding NarL/FixJ family response regulator n=1 Tax=Umezawaea tangerina TaxID=84725 RepID=A0A2T0TFM2_9PSEU|nr:response regulator transcription factor [Umezawaea tangerina]PRY44443.1 DNA-binding NarL/FixJ family response regulator [Umezawaea tangerina]